MKNSIEIRQERANAIEKANDLLNLAKNESRDFTNDEQTSYDGMMENIDKLAKDIEVVERQEKLNAEIAANVGSSPVQKTSETKEARSYSMFKAIKGMINNNLDGVEKEMHEEAVNEARSQGIAINGLGIPASMLEKRATVDQTNSAIAPTNILSYADAL
jgi:HK97 family phage major capsid protein